MTLNQYQIAALKFIESKGHTFFEEMQRELRFEIPKHEFKNTIESLDHYKLIKDCTEPGLGGFIKLTDKAIELLKPPKPVSVISGYYKPSSGNQSSLDRNRNIVTTPPTKAQKTIKEILIGLLVTILGGLILWYIIKRLEK